MAAFPTFTQIVNGNDSPNNAAPVMANLNAIVTFVNTYLVHLDGAKAMTANLSSNGTDPIAASDYARKFYVDAVFATETAARVAGDKAKTRVGWGVQRVAVFPYSGVPNVDTISFDTEAWDTDGFFAPTSTNITVPAGRGGLYMLYAELPQTNAISGVGHENWNLFVYVNGVSVSGFGSPFRTQFPSGASIVNTGNILVQLVAGDIVTFRAGCPAGSASINPNGTILFIGQRLSA